MWHRIRGWSSMHCKEGLPNHPAGKQKMASLDRRFGRLSVWVRSSMFSG